MSEVIGMLVAVVLSAGDAKPPSFLSVEWTVQQREQGKLGDAYHVFHLLCCQDCQGPKGCSLTVVTLNQCIKAGELETTFYPKVERWTTWEDQFTASWSRDHVELRLENEAGGRVTTTFLVGFKCESRKPGQLIATCKLTSVSGGYVKASALLNEVFTVEYVPLRDKNGMTFTTRDIDCKVMLPTVPHQPTK